MNAWTADELTSIASADELEIAPRRRDGSLARPRTIWVVRHGDDLFIRSVNGRTSGWFRGTQARHEGHIQAGGIRKSPTAEHESRLSSKSTGRCGGLSATGHYFR